MQRVSVSEFRASAARLVPMVTDRETIPLADSIGRVAAEAVTATVPLPAFVRSAVDGYALKAAERSLPLRLVGKVAAGHPAQRALQSGETFEITTGAPVPDGADAVALVEESRAVGDLIYIEEAVVAGSHISPEGEDFRRGQRLVAPGDVLTGVRVAALASQGLAAVEVWRRPRVAIVSTGDELTTLGEALPFGAVYDVNGAALEAMVRAAGAVPVRAGVLPDRYDAVRAGLQDLARRTDWDVLITSGGTGASVPLFQGLDVTAMHDLIPFVVSELGQLVHHGIRMVPGRPTALGLLGGRPVFQLPGWPYAVLIHFELMVRPALERMAHRPESVRSVIQARLDQALDVPAGFTRVIQVEVVRRAGEWWAIPLLPPPPPSASRMMTQMLTADGYVMLTDDAGEGRRWPAGSELPVFLEPSRQVSAEEVLDAR